MEKSRIVYPENKKDVIIVIPYSEIDREGKIRFSVPYMQNKAFSLNVKNKIPSNGVIKLKGYGLEKEDNTRGNLYLKFVGNDLKNKKPEIEDIYELLQNGKNIIEKINVLDRKKEEVLKQLVEMKKKEEELIHPCYYFALAIIVLVGIGAGFTYNFFIGIIAFFITASITDLLAKKICGNQIKRKKEIYHIQNIEPMENQLNDIKNEISILENDKIMQLLNKEFAKEYLRLDIITFFINTIENKTIENKHELIEEYKKICYEYTQNMLPLRKVEEDKLSNKTTISHRENRTIDNEPAIDLFYESNYKYFCETTFAQILETVAEKISLSHIYTILTPYMNNEYLEVIDKEYLIEPDEAILFAFSYSGCMKEGFVLSTSGITYRYSAAHDKVPTFIPYKDITDIYVEKYLLNKVLTIKFDDFTMPDKIFLVGMECIEEFEQVMKEFIIQVQNVRKNPLLIKDILD